MAVTATTPESLFIGAGDVLLDGDDLGATMDSNVFKLVREYYKPKLNGVRGPLKGTDYIVSETAQLVVTLPEISATIVALSSPNVESTPTGVDPVVTRITSSTDRRIASDQYHDLALRVPGLDGRYVEFGLTDAIVTDQPEYEAKDDGTLAPRLTFEARWDPEALDTAPWYIDVAVPAA